MLADGLYTFGDGAGGMMVLMSAIVLYLTGRITTGTRVGIALCNICWWAALSIMFVSFIYFAFWIHPDIGMATRGWFKASSGVCAFMSGALGMRFVILLRRWR